MRTPPSFVLLVALAGCGRGDGAGPPPVPRVTGGRPDVVVVTLDTTRADRIGAYGYAGARTEDIDALAAKGLRFEQAISPLPLTIPAHATMFTGLYPYHHGIRQNGDNVLAEDHTTLAEILADNGWVTAASVAAFVTTRQWGFSQGFDAYFDQMPEGAQDGNYWHTERDGVDVVNDAVGFVSAAPPEQPIFLWVHLYDAHYPYVPKGEYAETMGDRPYDAELAYVDDQVGRLVDAFAGRDVLWALVGDHGEALGEHDELTHGLFTYQSTQRVPWILSGAGVTPGVVRDPVSTADLTPTILRTLGLPVPDGLDGKPQPGSPQTPYAESWQAQQRFNVAPHRTIVDGTLKYVGVPKPELYDLAADPGETNNLADARPADVARLRGVLDGLGAAAPSADAAQLDADTVAQLVALGYVAGGGATVHDPLSLPDPKDLGAFFRKLRRLDGLARQGRAGPETLGLLDELIALKPDAFELRMRRLPLLARAGRQDEVKGFLEETSRLFPAESRVWITLSALAWREDDAAAALAHARKAFEVAPTQPGASESLVEALFRADRADEAVALGEAALAANPQNHGVAALLGRHAMRQRDFATAERHLRVAVSGPNPRRAARADLALLAIGAGARADAYTLLEAEVADYPGSFAARSLLARLLGEDERWLDQKEQLEAIARARPAEAAPRLAVAQCLFNLGDYRGARVELDLALGLAPEDADVLMLQANLLAKEGRRDEGYAVYLKAKAADDARRGKVGPTLAADGTPVPTPTPATSP